MIISAIVAVSKNGVIGKDEDIPWHLPADLAFFKRTTMNHHIIMGRSTFQAIGRPLPKRTNVVLTKNPFFIASGIIVARHVEEALSLAASNGETEVFICGGGEIYEQTKQLWDKIYYTEVDIVVENGDTFFPTLDLDLWVLHSKQVHHKDEKNDYNYSFNLYLRKEASLKD